MAVVTTGSTVKGLVPGLKNHMYGSDLMNVLGDPDGVVTPPQQTSSPSGGVIAFDSSAAQYYQNTTGSTWQKLGSVA